MYIFRLLFGTTSILSVIVSASAADSDFTFPLDGSLSSDQTDLSYSIPSDPPLDSTTTTTTSLFGSDTSSTEPLDGSTLPGDLLDPNSSEPFLWDDDSFQLADCSKSETPPVLPGLGKSRLRRLDADSSSCVNPNAAVPGGNPSDSTFAQVVLQRKTFDPEKHSITCFDWTGGLLPFAVFASGDASDVLKGDPPRMVMLPIRLTELVTLYRVKPGTRE